MAKIEMNYYDGNQYQILYPKVDLSNCLNPIVNGSYVGNGQGTITIWYNNLPIFLLINSNEEYGELLFIFCKSSGTKAFETGVYININKADKVLKANLGLMEAEGTSGGPNYYTRFKCNIRTYNIAINISSSTETFGKYESMTNCMNKNGITYYTQFFN